MDELMHYGTKRHSGRYPWGSGENPYQRLNRDFLKIRHDLEAKGLSESEVAFELGFKRWDKETQSYKGDTRGLRAATQVAKHVKMEEDRKEVVKLKEKGYSVRAIREKLDLSDSQVRNIINNMDQVKRNETMDICNELKKAVAEKKYIDVGKSVNIDLNCSEERLKNSLAILKQQGYEVHNIKIQQVGTGKFTDMKVLCPPGTTYGELMANRGEIKQLQNFVVDENGLTKLGMLKPVSVDSKRVDICYAEDGGKEKDGIIELRRGVDDISLGKANYAQVRIAVDDTHYLKGMAMYADDLPDGVDIRFNTNKTSDVSKMDVLKKMSDDPDNPFGATIKEEKDLKMCQRFYIDPKTGERTQSAINVVNEEGDWGQWKKSLSSQMLSKQDLPLIKRQLNEALVAKKAEYDDIQSITNPTIKKQMLQEFSDSCDYDAVHLKAAALPRQASRVILPFNDLSEKQIYAPSLRDGETVALIRYPHAGTFEIPVLTVTNKKDTSAKRYLQNSEDAVGINHKVAEQLSGADFDGDTVLVIPFKNANGDKIVNIKATKARQDLQEFEPKVAYKMPEGKSNGLTEGYKQKQMGIVSNLITDMTLKGAPIEEVTRAVKYSMVIIDAKKHNLDYKQAYKDCGIKELQAKWQNGGGASTIISKAKSPMEVHERKDGYHIDEKTGKRIYEDTNRTIKRKDPETGKYYDTGKLAMTKVAKMDYYEDANQLVSPMKHPKELAYADYANSLKALGNEARKMSMAVKEHDYSPAAKKQYAEQVASLDAKLLEAKKNQPRERQAHVIANEELRVKIAADPTIKEDHDKMKKLRNQALRGARAATGADKKSVQIHITDEEWKAIQAGAITKTKLKEIVKNVDDKELKKLAMPKAQTSLTNSQKNRIIAMSNNGKTLSEIADALGISTSTVSRTLNEGG